ncbi:DUF3099 domain-containing protein [Epidermidibacterium keratini]|uniref:DUF3099 domain-containing protein n=1 Tax=Epidermidibacterium keratini TaxID=1891644 RepID=A0A7L4YT46_9ACTN|nr:DUF3099 domain-containing protein [Epidermidibacterium keratini]QHC01949.1 DUF3099 domain-containing protein [Epidermidibacterium keratini]
MKKRDSVRPHLVTSAPQSREEEFAARKRRYVLTMASRAILLVVALLCATVSIWLAIGVGIISAILPWIAVVMANEGPPKSSPYYRAGRDRAPADHARQEEPDRRVIAAGPVIIDENGSTVRSPEKGTTA